MRRLERRSFTFSAAPAGRGRSCSGSARTSPSFVRASDSIRAFAEERSRVGCSRFVSGAGAACVRGRARRAGHSAAVRQRSRRRRRRAAWRERRSTRRRRTDASWASLPHEPPRPLARPRDLRRLDVCFPPSWPSVRSHLHGGAELRGRRARVGLELAREPAGAACASGRAGSAPCRRRRSGTPVGTYSRAPTRGTRLHQPVLERVEPDDPEAATGGEHPDAARERSSSAPSSSLTAIRSAWNTRVAGCRRRAPARDRRLDRLGEVGRALERPLFPPPDDRPRDPPRVALLAVPLEDQR